MRSVNPTESFDNLCDNCVIHRSGSAIIQSFYLLQITGFTKTASSALKYNCMRITRTSALARNEVDRRYHCQVSISVERLQSAIRAVCEAFYRSRMEKRAATTERGKRGALSKIRRRRARFYQSIEYKCS